MTKAVRFWEDRNFTLVNDAGDFVVYMKGAVGPCALVTGFFRPDDVPRVRTHEYCKRAGEPVLVLVGVKRPSEGFRVIIHRKTGEVLSVGSYIGDAKTHQTVQVSLVPEQRAVQQRSC